jgi:zinc transport system ATP-binding protein
MSIVIEVDNITVSYGQSEAIKNVSFEIQSGDFVGLVGSNGAGKTTLIKALLGLLPISSGEIKIFEQKIKQFNRWDKIDYLPQNIKSINPLFPATVEEVVFLGLLSSKKFPRHFSPNDKLRVEETLGYMRINNLKDKAISELSGGQQQRVLIARALVSKPEILILDEPTAALDSKSRDELMKLIKKLNCDFGITIILITHDTNIVCEYASKLMYLDRRMVFFGGVKEFYEKYNHGELLDEYGKHLISHQLK